MIEEGGLAPWEKDWNSSGLMPLNAKTNKPYRGINIWITMASQMLHNYQDPRWITLKQANNLGGQVIKGEKSTTIVFWQFPNSPKAESRDSDPIIDAGDDAADNGEETRRQNRRGPICKPYRVFNVEQTTGCRLKELQRALPVDHDPIAAAELITAEMADPPEIIHYATADHAPHYRPSTDQVFLPETSRYNRMESYYDTRFHELAHATGAPKRLHRFDSSRFELHDRGIEEMIAAMTSAMLSNACGLPRETITRNAAYIHAWADTIREDPGILITAAQRAQKAYNWITNAPPDGPANDDTEAEDDKIMATADREPALAAA